MRDRGKEIAVTLLLSLSLHPSVEFSQMETYNCCLAQTAAPINPAVLPN